MPQPKKKVCQHPSFTLLEFKNNPSEIFRIKHCHKCDTWIVSTESIAVITLDQLKEVLSNYKNGVSLGKKV